ncbi:MAG: hypothetical protein NVS3B14_02350 [Ktedonobacteraceae bacterium]
MLEKVDVGGIALKSAYCFRDWLSKHNKTTSIATASSLLDNTFRPSIVVCSLTLWTIGAGNNGVA